VPLFQLVFAPDMVSSPHAGFGFEANFLPNDAHHYVDYDYYEHYHRFGRGEEQLARSEKFPTHRQKRTWWWVS
jgi:hypothetical protein